MSADRADANWPAFGPRLCAAIVELECVPHPDWCLQYDDEECDCGIEAAKVLLWPLVGAGDDHGRVTDGHPLQLARNAGFAKWQAAEAEARP